MAVTEHANVGHDCHICDMSFRCSGHLTRHIRSHTNEKPFKCEHPGCNSAFTRSENLRRHELTHEPGSQAFSCDKPGCDKRFSTKQNLEEHVKAMHGAPKPKPFECTECDVAFTKKRDLAAHRAEVHGAAAPYPCPEAGCDKSFLFPSQVRRHLLRAHTEQTYVCMDEACAHLPAFKKFSDMQRHMRRVHAPQKNLQCEDCGKKFRTETGLQRHRPTHRLPVVDRLAFKCSAPGCKAAYTSSSNLGTHFRSKHVEQHRFICETCLKSFNLKSSLKRHVLKMHTQPTQPQAADVGDGGDKGAGGDGGEENDDAVGSDDEQIQDVEEVQEDEHVEP